MEHKEVDLSPSTSYKSLGQFLREQRLHRGLSQEALAEALDVSARSVRRWEQDQAIPQEVVRSRLRQFFGINLPSLLGTGTNQVDAPITSSFWQVPLSRNAFFTGRQELLQALHQKLRREQSMALTQSWAISGLGGIGKTQIALEYAYRHRPEYNAIFWISATTQQTLHADLVAIAQYLDLPEKSKQDYTQVILAVKKWLATHRDWLLILDNVDDLAFVRDILPAEHAGYLLLTTRAQAIGSVAQRIDVETMGLAEGTLFLLRRAKLLALGAFLDQAPQHQLAEAEAIVIEMDFLPLALDQAGAYIEEVGCDLSTYLDIYRSHRRELLQRRGHLASDHPESVVTTWSLNFQHVEQFNVAAAEILRLCAFLEPDTIPEELFSEGGLDLGPLLSPAAKDPLALNAAFEELRKFSLVQRVAENRLLRIHRLVQAVLKDAMGVEEQRRWAERAVRVVSTAFPITIEPATWPRCRRFLAQVQVSSILIQEYDFAFAEAAVLLSRAARYLHQAGLYEQASQLYHQALRIQEQVYGLEHPEVARSLKNLADLYRLMSTAEQAESLYQRALRIWEQEPGPEQPEMAQTLYGLATLYRLTEKYEQAESLYQRALRIWEQEPGPEQPEMAQTLRGLGLIRERQGKYEQAESLYRQALSIWEQRPGPEQPETASLLNSMVRLYASQGKYAQAEAVCQRALHIWEQTLGPEHPNLALPLNNLADLYSDQGKYGQAEPLYRQALHLWEQKHGPEHPDIAHPLGGLAKLYSKQGKNQQAEALYRRILSVQERTLGEHHLQTAETLHAFAVVLQSQGQYQEAREFYQRALATRAHILGTEHHKTAESRECLQTVLIILDKHEQAKQLEDI